MFLDFYRLPEQPFGVTPDPKYLYFSPGHREALASLFCGLQAGRGFLALVAEPGMGKTTLLYQLLERLKDSVHSVFLFQTQCNSNELLRYLMSALGLESRGLDLVDMHAQLNEFLLREARAGKPVLLVIDEAQNLSDSVLETLRLLSNFEAADRKLIQIVLAGQPELAQRLSQASLTQLRQRISILIRLEPLPVAETVRYVEHRLQVGGYDGPELFSSAALRRIAERSQGIPRNINNICFNALSLGCAIGRRTILPELVEEAARDLALAPPVGPLHALSQNSPAPRRRLWPFFAGIRERALRTRALQAVGVLVLCGSLMVYIGGGKIPGPQAAPSPASPPAAMGTVSASVAETAKAAPKAEEAPSDSHSVPPPTDGSKDPSQVFTYVVQRKDTLRDLCLWFIGRYDSSVRKRILELNPGLMNPDRISVGQQVYFPRYPELEGMAAGSKEKRDAQVK
jgi:general secretion pathway protein A